MRILEHHQYVEKVAHITCGRCHSKLEVLRSDFANHSDQREPYLPWQTTCQACQCTITCKELPTFDQMPAPLGMDRGGPMDR